MRSLVSDMSDKSGIEMVNTLSIKDLFEKCSLKHVDFMKIDVEGAELEIIRSEEFTEILPLVDVIELEIHFKGNFEKELLDIFLEHNLKIRKPRTVANVYIITKN